MCNATIKRRTVLKLKSQVLDNNYKNPRTAPVSSGSRAYHEVIDSKQKLLGAASALVISILSAASEFNIARQYENTLWMPMMYIVLNYGLTFLLALIISYSPAGRSLKPGGAKMKEPRMGVIGGGCIAIALWVGFGFFGPSGLLTFAGICTFILLILP